MPLRTFSAVLILLTSLDIFGATFGSVVVIGGHASDLALDERRGQLYVANFGGRRVEVMATSDNTLRRYITVPGEPGSLALSPDNRYLLITNYDHCNVNSFPCGFLTPSTTVPQLTVVDLDSNVPPVTSLIPVPTPPTPITTPVCAPQPPVPPVAPPVVPPVVPPLPVPSPPNTPLALAFGSGSRALLVTSTGIFLVDPKVSPPTFEQLPYPQVILTSGPLPTAFATFPPKILQASSGVSGDGQTIAVLAQVDTGQYLIRYNVGSGVLSAVNFSSVPDLGPRDVSVDRDGSNVLAGSFLLNRDNVVLAQFPYPISTINLGGHAFDYSRNLIYAQIPAAASDAPVIHIVDTDNLTVRERIQLPENLGGRSVFSSDMNTLYAISDSGVTILPIGSLGTTPRVSALEEQLLFLASNCDDRPLTQTLNIADLGGGHTDFTVSLSSNISGVRIRNSSGTTPQQVTIEVDPTAFRSQSGTSAVQLNIQSTGSVGLASPVRLLINTMQPDQRGTIHSLAGKIVDTLADPSRGRIYALRQDQNQVVVLDSTNFNTIRTLRTGNTPTQLAVSRDVRYLIVANDNSQIANVFDLETLQPTAPIVLPFGHSARSIAASNSAMLAVVRNAGTPPLALIDQIDFANRVATMPCSLGIYSNALLSPDAIMTTSPSGGSIFTAMADGTVLLFDDRLAAFEASRKDLSALGGAYAAISDNVFLAGGILFNRSLVQVGPLNGATATASVLISGNGALTLSANSSSGPGFAQTTSALMGGPLRPIRTAEAPISKAILTTPPVGQIGQTIPSFLRPFALADNGTIMYLSVSGFTEVPSNFGQAVPITGVLSVTDTANGGPVAPGSLITIAGSGLAMASGTATGLPLPTSLAGICATVNGFPLPLVQVSPTRIDAQLPYEVFGSANLVITGPGGKSSPFSFTAFP